MSFDLFQKVGLKANIASGALRPPDAVLRDYSRRPIPIGAKVELTFEWQGKSVTSSVYLRSEGGTEGETCLLGTNVIVPLGLMVPGQGVEPRTGEVPPGGSTTATIRLVQAKRVPGRTATLVQARTDSPFGQGGSVVFEPSSEWLDGTGLEA